MNKLMATVLLFMCAGAGFVGGYARHYDDRGDIQQLQQDHDWLDRELHEAKDELATHAGVLAQIVIRPVGVFNEGGKLQDQYR